jgi:small subunit ribosomal protein S6
VPEKSAYDLFVLIDADAPEERRAQILDAVKKQIDSGGGELKGDLDWGVRKLAFEIAHRGDAYYHLFQLEAGSELLGQLEHSLAINDAVLRHRIIRLPKGVPDKPPPQPSPSPPRSAQPADESSRPPAAAAPEATEVVVPEASEAAVPEASEAPQGEGPSETPQSDETSDAAQRPESPAGAPAEESQPAT